MYIFLNCIEKFINANLRKMCCRVPASTLAFWVFILLLQASHLINVYPNSIWQSTTSTVKLIWNIEIEIDCNSGIWIILGSCTPLPQDFWNEGFVAWKHFFHRIKGRKVLWSSGRRQFIFNKLTLYTINIDKLYNLDICRYLIIF